MQESHSKDASDQSQLPGDVKKKSSQETFSISSRPAILKVFLINGFELIMKKFPFLIFLAVEIQIRMKEEAM